MVLLGGGYGVILADGDLSVDMRAHYLV